MGSLDTSYADTTGLTAHSSSPPPNYHQPVPLWWIAGSGVVGLSRL